MSALTLSPTRTDYDPLRDKSYRDTALGPDVGAWLAWLELCRKLHMDPRARVTEAAA